VDGAQDLEEVVAHRDVIGVVFVRAVEGDPCDAVTLLEDDGGEAGVWRCG